MRWVVGPASNTGAFAPIWQSARRLSTSYEPAPQSSIAAAKTGPTGASAADQGVRPTNRHRLQRFSALVVHYLCQRADWGGVCGFEGGDLWGLLQDVA
jgi:hypothetical protein